jgi:hypothetical protein
MKDNNKLDKLVFFVMWNFYDNVIVQNRRVTGFNVDFFIFHMVAFRIEVKIFNFYPSTCNFSLVLTCVLKHAIKFKHK